MLLVKKLVQVHDAFQLRQEMLWMMGTCLFCVGKHRGCRHKMFPFLKLSWYMARFPTNTRLSVLVEKERHSFCLFLSLNVLLLLALHVRAPHDDGSEATTTTIQVLVVWGALPDTRGVHVATEVFFLLLGLATAPWR